MILIIADDDDLIYADEILRFIFFPYMYDLKISDDRFGLRLFKSYEIIASKMSEKIHY